MGAVTVDVTGAKRAQDVGDAAGAETGATDAGRRGPTMRDAASTDRCMPFVADEADIDLAFLAAHAMSGDSYVPDVAYDAARAEHGGVPNAVGHAAHGVCGGTLIATPDGARPVETLRDGDLVLTADGVAMAVRALRRSVVPQDITGEVPGLPVRIRAGALDAHIPARDLLVASGHALRIGKVLVQAGALVNGTTVTRDPDAAGALTWYSLELDTHALVIAEGAAAESFLDEGDARGAAATMQELPYPRARSARQLPPALREHLAARAEAPRAGPSAERSAQVPGSPPSEAHPAAPQGAVSGDDPQPLQDLAADPFLIALRDLLFALARRGGPDLTVRQFTTFLAVYMGVATHTISSLAGVLRIGRPALLRIIDRLVDLDLVAREEDREDRRSMLVCRTACGAAFFRDLARISHNESAGRTAAAA